MTHPAIRPDAAFADEFLHSLQCHDEWEYRSAWVPMTGGNMSWSPREGQGWELNTAVGVRGQSEHEAVDGTRVLLHHWRRKR